MNIRIQMSLYVLSINIGHKTMWFEQLPFISIVKEYYNVGEGDKNKDITFASSIWNSPYKLSTGKWGMEII